MRRDRRGALSELTFGARAIVDGLAFVVGTKGALKTALMPATLAVGVGCALAGVGLWGVVVAGHSLVSAAGPLAALGRALFDVALGSLVLFVAVVIALAIAQPLSRGALERLTRRLTESMGVHEAKLPSSHFFTSIGTALATIGVTLPTIGVIEGLTAVAPEAAFLTEPVAFVVSALALSWELFDHPMSRRGWTMGQRFRWMRQNAAVVIGFAIGAQTLLMLPVLDLFLLPVGILGATKLVAMRGENDGGPLRKPELPGGA